MIFHKSWWNSRSHTFELWWQEIGKNEMKRLKKITFFPRFRGSQACLRSLAKEGTPPQFHQFDYQLWPRKLCCPNLINSKSLLAGQIANTNIISLPDYPWSVYSVPNLNCPLNSVRNSILKNFWLHFWLHVLADTFWLFQH